VTLTAVRPVLHLATHPVMTLIWSSKPRNRASEKDADEMLKEVDRQLDSLIKALDELDTVDTKELPE